MNVAKIGSLQKANHKTERHVTNPKNFIKVEFFEKTNQLARLSSLPKLKGVHFLLLSSLSLWGVCREDHISFAHVVYGHVDLHTWTMRL